MHFLDIKKRSSMKFQEKNKQVSHVNYAVIFIHLKFSKILHVFFKCEQKNAFYCLI